MWVNRLEAFCQVKHDNVAKKSVLKKNEKKIYGLKIGIITDAIGRRKTMLLVNIPHIIAWLMLGYANSITITYIAFGLLGIGVGLMEVFFENNLLLNIHFFIIRDLLFICRRQS